MARLRLHGEDTGERGSGELVGLGANRGVSRAADDEAELTEVAGMTETPRKRWTTVSSVGTLWACARC